VGVRIALGATVGGVDGFERSDFGWRKDEGSIQATRAVAGLRQLHDDDCGAGRDGHKLDKAIGGLDLAVFDPQTLLLQGAKELLDN
jgi:hypothetical protein